MPSFSRTEVLGHVGKDAELRYLGNGTAQAKFSVAVSRNRKDKQDQWVEETEWFNVVAWAELAERVSKNVTKGALVFVEGRMQTRTWDDDQGTKHYMTELVANTVLSLDKQPKTEGQQSYPSRQQRPQQQSSRENLPFE
jgi:single-strand DNA-binding protein